MVWSLLRSQDRQSPFRDPFIHKKSYVPCHRKIRLGANDSNNFAFHLAECDAIYTDKLQANGVQKNKLDRSYQRITAYNLHIEYRIPNWPGDRIESIGSDGVLLYWPHRSNFDYQS